MRAAQQQRKAAAAIKARSPVAFGRYIITRRIARGGMAEIYRARTRASPTEESRWVAVKMMRSSLGHEELRTRLFEREARIASKLHHPNVVPLYEYGQEMDRPFLAMEYVRGRDLSHLLKTEKRENDLIPFEVGLYVGFLAARGLGHAHRLKDDNNGNSLGIVHRDISPGNVMVGYDATVKVLDFGVARINETQGVHTQTGTLRGKFAYMSPEQTLGEDLDARSDVFSFGTVLYELLTGINCFRAQNPIATLERVQGLRPVPPSRANRKIPKAVDRILARCLAKDKKRRFKDAQALCEAIGDFLDGENIDGKAALLDHMSQCFSWEKHEEESELLREEEEVALFDVVDFAALSDDGGLDAKNVQISEEEEASESEVKKVGAYRQPIDEGAEVFQAEAGGATETDLPIEAPEGDEEATLAQQRSAIFDENIEGQEVQVASLLDSVPPAPSSPAAEPEVATSARSNPMFAPAGLNLNFTPGGTLTDAETVDPTVMRGHKPPPPTWQRPIVWGPAIGALVLIVALAVTFSLSGESPEEVRPGPTTIAPVTITLDDPGEKDPPKRVAPPPKRRPQNVAQAEPPPGEDPAPIVRNDPPRQPSRVRPVRSPPVTKTPRKAPRRRVVRRQPKRSAGTGFLNVGAKPWGQIKIDGKRWPYQTPQAGIRLPAGKHTVTLHNPETGVTKKTVVYVKAGAYKTVMMDLRRR